MHLLRSMTSTHWALSSYYIVNVSKQTFLWLITNAPTGGGGALKVQHKIYFSVFHPFYTAIPRKDEISIPLCVPSSTHSLLMPRFFLLWLDSMIPTNNWTKPPLPPPCVLSIQKALFEVKFTWAYWWSIYSYCAQHTWELTVMFELELKKLDQNTLDFLHKSHSFPSCAAFTGRINVASLAPFGPFVPPNCPPRMIWLPLKITTTDKKLPTLNDYK